MEEKQGRQVNRLNFMEGAERLGVYKTKNNDPFKFERIKKT